MTKDELLATSKRERAQLVEVVEGLDDVRIAAPGLDGAWSVKDHLSHIAAWERMVVAHLVDGSDAAVAGMDAASYAAATLDELNDQLYRLHRDRTAVQVRGEFDAAHESILSYLQRMPEERLSAPYWDDQAGGKTVLDKLTGDTYEHYAEHAEWIHEMIASGVGKG